MAVGYMIYTEDDNGRSICRWTWEGKTYELHEEMIYELAALMHEFPVGLREQIMHWADMIHNPD